MDLALNLYYNSQVWLGTKEAGFSFDLAADWPAPGFQLDSGALDVQATPMKTVIIWSMQMERFVAPSS